MIKKKILFFFTLGLCFCRCEYSFSELNFKASLLKIDLVTSAVEKYLLESPYSASQSLVEANNNLYLSGIVFFPLPSYYQWITDLNGKVTKKTLLLSPETTDILLVPVTSNNPSVFLSIENQLFTS